MPVDLPSLDALRAFADEQAALLPRGEFVGFSGELGTGKTTLIQQLVRALGFDGEVLSPTYTLEHVYPLSDGIQIHHWDLYRLNNSSDWSALRELERRREAIILIEWPERISEVERLLTRHYQLEYAGSGRQVRCIEIPPMKLGA